MTDNHVAFVGSIPANYDRYLGPLFFHGFADDLVTRLRVRPHMRVLELACGTGIVTERLARRLAGVGTLVATDLNEAMLAYAQSKGFASGVTWQQADATALPFDDASCDAVVCQFGFMFFPDKSAGAREAWRVLRPGGQLLFNVWDTLARNPVARITHESVAGFFPSDPPQFYTVPFSLHDAAQVGAWVSASGFTDIASIAVSTLGSSPSAAEAAIGLIEGNPICGEISARRADSLAAVEAAVARNVAAELGDRPVRAELHAIVFSATKR
jgi:SAM-dependent methyltransferase